MKSPRGLDDLLFAIRCPRLAIGPQPADLEIEGDYDRVRFDGVAFDERGRQRRAVHRVRVRRRPAFDGGRLRGRG